MKENTILSDLAAFLFSNSSDNGRTPSERELVHQFHVARMTVRQAMDALVGEGLLERIPGRGTFVAQPRRDVGRLLSYSEEMAARGLLPESINRRRNKIGFTTPQVEWFMRLKNHFYNIFLSESFAGRPYVNQTEVIAAFEGWIKGANDVDACW